MTQNLHSLIDLLPNGIQQLAEAFRRRFKSGRVGTLMSDISAMDLIESAREQSPLQDIDGETRCFLGEWMRQQPNYSKFETPTRAEYLKKWEYQGAELKPKWRAFGDSLVIIGDYATTWRAAQIETLLDIRLYPSGVETHHTVAKVRYFAELSERDALHDPYRRSGNTGRVFYEDGMENKEVVSIDQISCHFAMTPNVCSSAIHKGHIHALPLFRVR